ncbi:hypothetical protein LSI54_10930 [Nesterenkonia sp. AY15]|uniref:hypothetical protein n=1 Tax=Nesterenkonia sp. AY15 TaxID=2901139 RepID=UPI001F4C95D3|nr:hypothetical protein [Nesterenkonia sp. AY15]MCH8571863.1 hypothetical protein [Nesterenkonia sp. AY15]
MAKSRGELGQLLGREAEIPVDRCLLLGGEVGRQLIEGVEERLELGQDAVHPGQAAHDAAAANH